MNLNHDDNPCPRISGRFKLAVAAVFVALVVAVGQSPIDWSPMTTTVHDVAATTNAATTAPHDASLSPLETTEATPHIEAF